MATENTTDDLEEALLDSAVEGVASVTADGMTVTEQRLTDRIKVLERGRTLLLPRNRISVCDSPASFLQVEVGSDANRR